MVPAHEIGPEDGGQKTINYALNTFQVIQIGTSLWSGMKNKFMERVRDSMEIIPVDDFSAIVVASMAASWQ